MKKYLVTTPEGDNWTYDDYDSAARAQYIFGGTIKRYTVEDEFRICPVCGKEYSSPPALSRKDNTTEICTDCGLKEAFDEFFGGLEK